MDSRAAIKSSLDTADMIVTMYLGDLNDVEMLKRPAPNCNHIAWQLGHLILSEHQMIEASVPGSMPALPAGFETKYAHSQATLDRREDFDSKDFLVDLYRQQRAAALACLQKLSDTDLDRETPEQIRSYAPTVGAAFSMIGIHWTMHAGQWAVIRRQLGRAPLF